MFGGAVLWAPLAMLAVWAGAYVYACAEWVASPGKPMFLILPTRGENVRLSAESYSLDWRNGILHARNAVLEDPEGIDLASARRLQLDFPSPFGTSGPALRLRASGLRLLVERDPEGRIKLLDYLPPESEEPSRLPYSILIRDSTVRLIDVGRRSEWRKDLRIESLRVDGVGESFVASASALEPISGGRIEATIWVDPDLGTAGRASVSSLELSQLLAHLGLGREGDRWPWLREVSADRMRAAGTIAAGFPRDEPAWLSGNIRVQATNVRVAKRYRFSLAHFDGSLTETGAGGTLRARDGRFEAEFQGKADWSEGIRIAGLLDASAPSLDSCPPWLRFASKEDLDLRGLAFHGELSFSEPDGARLRGPASAATATIRGQKLQMVKADLYASNALIGAGAIEATWNGARITGRVETEPKSGRLRGQAQATDVSIGALAKAFDLGPLIGTGRASLAVAGSRNAPEVVFRAAGRLAAKPKDREALELGDAVVSGKFKDGFLTFEQALVQGGPGVLAARGAWRSDRDSLDLEVQALGIDLNRISPQLQGTAAVRFQVTGSARNPQASGLLEAFGVQYEGEELPFLSAALLVNREQLTATSLTATRGAARLKGGGSWSFESGNIDGTFAAEGVPLGDYLGPDFAGTFALERASVSGSVESPLVELSASGTDLVARGIKIDKASATGRIEGSTVHLAAFELEASGGRAAAQGSYDWNKREGAFSLSAKGVPLEKTVPALPGDLVLRGLGSAEANATFKENRIDSFVGRGSIHDLYADPTYFGSGTWEAAFQDGAWSGSALLGQIERYLELSEFRYDPSSEAIDGTFVAYNMPFRDLYFAMRPSLSAGETRKTRPAVELSPTTLQNLDAFEARIDANVTVRGQARDPEVEIETLTLREMAFQGAPGGQLDAKAQRRAQGFWTIESLKWTNGAAHLDVQGTVEEQGQIAIDGNLNNIRTDWLARFEPAFGRLRGAGDFSFLLSGRTESPHVEASLNAKLFEPFTDRPDGAQVVSPDSTLKLNLYRVTVDEGELGAQGAFSYQGFKGSVAAKLPFRYPFEVPEGEPLSVNVALDRRPLRELKELIPALDIAKTDGVVYGDVSLRGDRQNLGLEGGFGIENGAFGLQGAQTYLRNLTFRGAVGSGKVDVTASAESSSGGTFQANAQMAVAELADALRDPALAILESPISGDIRLSAFGVQEDHGRSGRAELNASGSIRLGGTVGMPTLTASEPILLDALDALAPAELTAGTEPFKGSINPKFAIDFRIGSPQRRAQVSTTSGSFELSGQGSLEGTLAEPELSASMRVHSGAIRLPNARISVQDGGTMRLTYTGSAIGESDARLDLDLAGETSLTALKYSGTVERYDIRLQIRGNILAEGGTRITAQSDPPDLAQDRILALLGQGDLLESLGPTMGQSELQRQLQTAFTGIAFPMLLDPYTRRLAQDLGLEFLTVEYNPYEGPTLTAAKSLGRGLMLTYRRQIGEALYGEPRYDLRLSYKPFARRGFWRNVFLSLGSDQDRPYKLSIEYGIRY